MANLGNHILGHNDPYEVVKVQTELFTLGNQLWNELSLAVFNDEFHHVGCGEPRHGGFRLVRIFDHQRDNLLVNFLVFEKIEVLFENLNSTLDDLLSVGFLHGLKHNLENLEQTGLIEDLVEILRFENSQNRSPGFGLDLRICGRQIFLKTLKKGFGLGWY